MEVRYCSFIVVLLFGFIASVKPAEQCTNKSVMCGTYRILGHCKSQYDWMKQNCPISCGFPCPTKAPDSSCIDEAIAFCTSASAARCNDKDFKDYMSKFCRKTCGLCDSSINTTPKSPTDESSSCGIRGDGHTRIVGGSNARPGDWPWQVQIDKMWHPGRYWCGGTLLNDEWILSAAHCFEDSLRPKRYKVYLGEHDINSQSSQEQKIEISQIIMHPSYDRDTMANDLALLKLSKKAKLNNFIRPACFPDKSTSFPVGEECYVTGWGALSTGGSFPRILQQAKIPLISQSKCEKAMGGITDSMFCAGFHTKEVDSCQGDSGGPLVCRKQKNGKDVWYLWGVVSWGYECAAPGFYGVYASTQKLSKFVVDHVFK